jgi:secondary thiamine-phosphate synthase enzyme
MRQAQTTITVATDGPGLFEFTREAVAWVADQGIDSGLLTLFCRHTSASLLIQENADPDVCHDLLAFFRGLVREDPALYRHTQEGADDMPAHIRSALTAVSLAVPVGGGRPLLGTWQGLYLFEHRYRPQRRQVVLHLQGA